MYKQPVFLAGGSRSPERRRPDYVNSGLKAGADLGTHMFKTWYNDYAASLGPDHETDNAKPAIPLKVVVFNMLQVGIAFNEKLIRTLIFNALGISQRD